MQFDRYVSERDAVFVSVILVYGAKEREMNSLQAGFARVNVTPMLGIHVAGYYKERIAEGIMHASTPHAEITGSATVAEHCPTQEIS